MLLACVGEREQYYIGALAMHTVPHVVGCPRGSRASNEVVQIESPTTLSRKLSV